MRTAAHSGCRDTPSTSYNCDAHQVFKLSARRPQRSRRKQAFQAAKGYHTEVEDVWNRLDLINRLTTNVCTSEPSPPLCHSRRMARHAGLTPPSLSAQEARCRCLRGRIYTSGSAECSKDRTVSAVATSEPVRVSPGPATEQWIRP